VAPISWFQPQFAGRKLTVSIGIYCLKLGGLAGSEFGARHGAIAVRIELIELSHAFGRVGSSDSTEFSSRNAAITVAVGTFISRVYGRGKFGSANRAVLIGVESLKKTNPSRAVVLGDGDRRQEDQAAGRDKPYQHDGVLTMFSRASANVLAKP